MKWNVDLWKNRSLNYSSYSIYLNVTFPSHPEPIKDESSEIQKSGEPVDVHDVTVAHEPYFGMTGFHGIQSRARAEVTSSERAYPICV